MKLVMDTNVFISGVFFGGVPHEILDAWRRDRVQLVVSPQIIEEYRETGEELAADFSDVDLAPWIQLLCIRATVVEAPALEEQVCSDPDDDKFLSCALAGRSQLIVSGDKALLRTSGYNGVTVLTPRKFVDEYLRKSNPTALTDHP